MISSAVTEQLIESGVKVLSKTQVWRSYWSRQCSQNTCLFL